jgi:hypothetical protein
MSAFARKPLAFDTVVRMDEIQQDAKLLHQLLISPVRCPVINVLSVEEKPRHRWHHRKRHARIPLDALHQQSESQ